MPFSEISNQTTLNGIKHAQGRMVVYNYALDIKHQLVYDR
jgi:hypothetical protein